MKQWWKNSLNKTRLVKTGLKDSTEFWQLLDGINGTIESLLSFDIVS
jgi:hypothetical protein